MLNASFAQEITLVDRLTQERIPGVKIVCKNGDARTIANSEGRFRLETFAQCDTLVISYESFVVREMSYRELLNVVTIELEEVQLNIKGVVVSASRWEEDLLEIPNRVAPISLRDIELENPQTTADLLSSSGYVYVQKSQFAGGSPQLRGYGTNRVMIVVDGIRMNNAIFRSGNLQNILSIDPMSLSGAEVLFGPGSVMYGSDAIGGVMDFTTKLSPFSMDSINHTSSNVFSRYSSASNEIMGHADFVYSGQRFAATTALTYSRFGDLMAGLHGDSAYLRPTFQQNGQTFVNENPRKQVHSGYDQFNALQKFRFQLKKGVNLTYGLIYSTNFQDAPRYDRLIQDANNDGILDYAQWYYGPQEWMMNRIELEFENKTRLYDDLRIVIAEQEFKESRHDQKTGSSKIRHQFEEVHALSLNIDLEKELGHNSLLFYGFESVLNKVNSNAHNEFDDGTTAIINSRYPDGSLWQTHAVYGSLKHHLNENWSATAGIRLAMFAAHAEFDTTLFPYPISETQLGNVAPSASLGIVYRPNSNSQWYFNVSNGFRAPNIDDLGKVFDSEPGTVVVPNTQLRPEYAYSAETGFLKVLGAKLKLDGAIYATYLDNVLVRDQFSFNGQDSILYEGELSEVVAIQNESNAYTYGFQAGIEWAIVKGLTFRSTISYQKGRQFDSDSSAYFPKAQVAPTFGRVSLNYKTRQLKVEAYWVYNGRVDYEDFPLNERDQLNYALDANGNVFTPAWSTFNIKGSYFFNKHVSMTLGVENLTNVLYRTYGSGISSAGRNFIFSTKVSF